MLALHRYSLLSWSLVVQVFEPTITYQYNLRLLTNLTKHNHTIISRFGENGLILDLWSKSDHFEKRVQTRHFPKPCDEWGYFNKPNSSTD